MKNTYTQILLSYFKHKLFWIFVLTLPLFFLGRGYFLISTIVPADNREMSSIFFDLIGIVTLCFIGLTLSCTLGMHLKALTANPIAIMLPGGRSKPIVAVYWLISACLMAGMALFMRPGTDTYGLFAVCILGLALAMLIGFLQGPYALLLIVVPLLFAHFSLPFIAITKGKYPHFATAYILLGLATLAFLAYEAITMTEERRQYAWNRLSYISKSMNVPYENRETSWFARLGAYFYKAGNFKDVRYDAAAIPVRFTHWRVALGKTYNPVFLTLSMTVFSFILFAITTTIDKSGNHEAFFTDLLIFILYVSLYGSLVFFSQRRNYFPLECVLPLTRRQYVINMGGMLFIATFANWLSITISVLLTLYLIYPAELTHAFLWMHIALSACCTFAAYGVACVFTRYANKMP